MRGAEGNLARVLSASDTSDAISGLRNDRTDDGNEQFTAHHHHRDVQRCPIFLQPFCIHFRFEADSIKSREIWGINLKYMWLCYITDEVLFGFLHSYSVALDLAAPLFTRELKVEERRWNDIQCKFFTEVLVKKNAILICFFCLTKTQLVGVDCCCHLWECAESECTLHFANVIVQNGSWAERLCKLEAVDDLQWLTNRLFNTNDN